MQRYPKVGPYFRGKWSSPTDGRFLRVSGQGPDSPTPREWNLWTHPWRSTVPEMKTHFTNGPWEGFLFSQKNRSETGEVNSAQVIFWYIHANLYGANCCSNLISCFFIRWWYPPSNMKSSWVWTRQEKYTNYNQQWVVDAEVLCSTHWVTFTIYMSSIKTAVFREDKVQSGFKRTQTVMRMASSHWWEVSQHFIHTKHYSKAFIHMNLSST